MEWQQHLAIEHARDDVKCDVSNARSSRHNFLLQRLESVSLVT